MIRNVAATESFNSLFDDKKTELLEKKEYKGVHDSFQSIFDVELEKAGLTMEDVTRLQKMK